MEEDVKLDGLKFSVCALGDTSYEQFCEIGRQFDARLEKLGGRRIADRVDCDVDYEESYSTWFATAMTALAPTAPAPVPVVHAGSGVVPTVEFGKKNPFLSEVYDNVMLNGEGSSKETIHVELSMAGSNLTYEPGDALAVQPNNCPAMVKEILGAAKLVGTEEIEVKGAGTKLLADALREDFDITALSKAVLKKLAEASGSATLAGMLTDDSKDKLREYIDGREIVDAITDFAPEGLSAGDLAGIFRKLPIRLYSIASSPLAHPDEVHLTVAAVRYESHGRLRKGVCSTFLADVAKTGESVPIFVQPNKNFRLPADGNTPIIMVGPAPAWHPSDPLLSTAPPSDRGGRAGCFSATSTTPMISSTNSNGRISSRRDLFRNSMSRSQGISRKRSTFRTGCWRKARNSMPGLRKERISTSAAMPAAWPQMSTRLSSPS